MKLPTTRYRLVALLCAGGVAEIIARGAATFWSADKFFIIALFVAIAVLCWTDDDDEDYTKVRPDDGRPVIPRKAEGITDRINDMPFWRRPKITLSPDAADED